MSAVSAVPEDQQTTTAPAVVRADKDVCIGAGLCALAAPRVFDQDEDGVVEVLEPAPRGADLEAAATAATTCPAEAISVRR